MKKYQKNGILQLKEPPFYEKHCTGIELDPTIHKTPLNLEEIKEDKQKPQKSRLLDIKCLKNTVASSNVKYRVLIGFVDSRRHQM